VPELPEVERGRRLAESVALSRRIERVRCARDEIVFAGVSPVRMGRALKGKEVRAVRRWGKQLWFELSSPPHPLFHFGMTGAFVAPATEALSLQSAPPPDTAWPPRFTKIHLWLDDGGELVMTNARRLGRILLRDDPFAEEPLRSLGFDPLLGLPGPADFARRAGRRRTPIKALLLDQGFAAGVGNWIADEVLYQAKIDPRRRADTLSEVEAKRIRSCMKRIIEKAVAVDAEKKRFPRAWLFHRRWGRNSEAVTARGEKIRHITLAGRTTAWVPGVQR